MILPMDSQLRRFFNSRTQRNASKVWKKWRRLWSGEIPMDRARGAWNTEIVVLSDETHFGNHPGQENQCGITLCVVIVFARCLNIQYSIVGPIITVHTWDSRSSLSLVISIFFGKFPASNWMLRQKMYPYSEISDSSFTCVIRLSTILLTSARLLQDLSTSL